MSDAEIEEIAARLEAEIEAKTAHFVVRIHGGDADESHGEGNRSGFLRAAAIFLRGATLPEGQNSISDDKNALFDEDSDIFFSFLQRRENWPEPSPHPQPTRARRFLNAVAIGGCVLVLVILLILFFTGVVAGYNTIYDALSH